MNNDNNTIQCPNGCTHSKGEHLAFDRGREAGKCGDSESTNPFYTDHLREIWRVGYSVGELEREAEQEVAL
jgi:ribosome modulation factor